MSSVSMSPDGNDTVSTDDSAASSSGGGYDQPGSPAASSSLSLSMAGLPVVYDTDRTAAIDNESAADVGSFAELVRDIRLSFAAPDENQRHPPSPPNSPPTTAATLENVTILNGTTHPEDLPEDISEESEGGGEARRRLLLETYWCIPATNEDFLKYASSRCPSE